MSVAHDNRLLLGLSMETIVGEHRQTVLATDDEAAGTTSEQDIGNRAAKINNEKQKTFSGCCSAAQQG